jgi:hypothetical protein
MAANGKKCARGKNGQADHLTDGKLASQKWNTAAVAIDSQAARSGTPAPTFVKWGSGGEGGRGPPGRVAGKRKSCASFR